MTDFKQNLFDIAVGRHFLVILQVIWHYIFSEGQALLENCPNKDFSGLYLTQFRLNLESPYSVQKLKNTDRKVRIWAPARQWHVNQMIIPSRQTSGITLNWSYKILHTFKDLFQDTCLKLHSGFFFLSLSSLCDISLFIMISFWVGDFPRQSKFSNYVKI